MSFYSFNWQLISRHSVTSKSSTSQRQREEDDAKPTSHAGVKRQADEDDIESSSSYAKRVRLDTPDDESECEEMRQEHTLRVQTAMHAAHLLSSSPYKTHSVGINIRGTLRV